MKVTIECEFNEVTIVDIRYIFEKVERDVYGLVTDMLTREKALHGEGQGKVRDENGNDSEIPRADAGRAERISNQGFAAN